MEEGRLAWLDRVKGIGILFVVIGHVYVGDGFWSRIIHGLNVPLFFIASGYLTGVKEEWKKAGSALFFKKVHNILRPYFFYSGVVMIWLLFRLIVFGYGSLYEILHCLADIFCLEGISVLWFLSALFLGEMFTLFIWNAPSLVRRFYSGSEYVPFKRYVACGVVGRGNFAGESREELGWLMTLFILFLSGTASLSWLVGQPWTNISLAARLLAKLLRILSRGLAAAAFMVMGIGFSRFKECQIGKGWQVLFLPLAAAGLWANGLRDFHYLSFGNIFLYFFNGFLGFAAAAGIGWLLSWDKIVKFLGKNSLIIMATHLILLDFINIMAIRLSPIAGRYLGDELGVKLAAVAAGEVLILAVRQMKKA